MEPSSPSATAIALMNISAMKLSEGGFICRISWRTVDDRQAATGSASSGVRPRRVEAGTSTPRWRSCLAKPLALNFAGRGCQ